MGIIYGILLCVFLFDVRDFTVVMQGLLTYLCTFLGNNISNYLLIIASHHHRFTHINWDFLGRISGSTNVRTFVSLIFLLLYLVVVLLYKYGYYCPPRLGRIRTRTPTNPL